MASVPRVRSDSGFAQIVYRSALFGDVVCRRVHWAHAGLGFANLLCQGGGMPTEHLCIPKCVAGGSLAQGALTVLECVMGSWLANRTNSTGVIALLVLGVFSPGLGPTLSISSLIGMILLLGAGRLGHRPAWSRPVRSGLEGASSHRTSLPATRADSWHSILGRRVCLPGSPPLQGSIRNAVRDNVPQWE